MKTFCDRWTDRTTTGTEIIDLHEYENGFYGVVRYRSGTMILSWLTTGAARNHTLGDLVPLPKPKVLRPFRDLPEFAAAVHAVMPADMRGVPPGMCLAFVWVRESAGLWHRLGVGAVNWQWRLDSGMEWTIDPTSPVGRPFGVEE